MLFARDGSVGFVVAFAIVHYVCSVEIVDVERSCNVGSNIVEEGVDIAFNRVNEGGKEATIGATGVKELGVADAGGV
jgi:hypothetical protein